MDEELFKEIKKTNVLLTKLFEQYPLEKITDDSNDSAYEGNLRNIHGFINLAFIFVLSSIDRFLKEQVKKIKNIGYSVNYYPQYTDGTLKGRIQLEDELKTFIFKNNDLTKVFNEDRANNISEIISKKLLNDYLNTNHIYKSLLEVFYNLLDHINNKRIDPPKVKELFSIKSYFETAVSEEEQIIYFEKLEDFENQLNSYIRENETYNYDDYRNYLIICLWKNSQQTNKIKLIDTENKKYWNSEGINKIIQDWTKKTQIIEYYYQYNISANDRFVRKSRGNIVIYCDEKIDKEILDKIKFICDYFITTLAELEARYLSEKQKHDVNKSNLRTGIIAILVDSFAHNIAAHSLKYLTWIFDQRTEILDKKFFLETDGYLKKDFSIVLSQLKDKVSKAVSLFEKQRGLEDSRNSESFTSIGDVVEQMDSELHKSLLTFNEQYGSYDSYDKAKTDTIPRLTLPLDKHVRSLINYLNEKSTFWNGITSDLLSISYTTTWYQLLWDFVNNPLFLGTIARDKETKRITFYINLVEQSQETNKELLEFVTIDIEPILDDIRGYSEKKIESYSLIKLGASFEPLRQKLEAISIFLPNGVVGKHSLFTLFENTLRNIKHVHNIKNDPIEHIIFNLLIDTSDEKVFTITNWLGNPSELRNEKDEVIEKKINRLLKKPIVDSLTGAIKMGGNSQDKTCACQLFTNYFSKVENQSFFYKNINKYPWITIKEEKLGKKSSRNHPLGYIKKTFYAWKGAENYVLNCDTGERIEDLMKNENINRFKFILLQGNSEETKANFKDDLSQRGLIRILDEIADGVYREWNKFWIAEELRNSTILLCSYENNEENPLYKIEFSNKLGWYCSDKLSKTEKKNLSDGIRIAFQHGETKENEIFERRTHGVLNAKFLFPDTITLKDSDELVETLLTNIHIYDKRIFDRISDKKKIELMKKLYLFVFPERNPLSIIGDNKENVLLRSTYQIDKSVNFIIIHLSYIESLGYTEDNFKQFIDDYMRSFLERDNVRLIITTGRGRAAWKNNIEKEDYNSKVLSIAIDSLLNAVQSALIFNDDFQIKYNLIKTIFGS